MIDTVKKQAQGRIKRQMLEQSLAVPLNDTHPMSLVNRLSEKMLRDIDKKMLETTPIYKVSTYADKVKLDHIPPEKFYRTSCLFSGEQYGKDVARNIMDTFTKPELELTLANGVFE